MPFATVLISVFFYFLYNDKVIWRIIFVCFYIPRYKYLEAEFPDESLALLSGQKLGILT